MRVPAKRLPLLSGGHDVVVLGKNFARELDLHPMDRVIVKNPADHSKWVTAHLNFWYETNPVVGLFGDTFDKLGIKNGDEVSMFPAPKPSSVSHIIRKMDRQQLTEKEIFEIVRDIVDAKLTDLEIASFITSTYMAGTTLDETYYLAKAIAETGDMLDFETDIVADKHCSGSVPGNRTTPIVVPAVAALGITIPKSSSRSITSPAGTADVMEVLCRVTFTRDEIRKIVSKTNGCIIWGGGLKIAPADAKLITVRKPLKADPEGLLISSILSKKYAMGATHIMLDIPLGLETRYNNIGEAKLLERELIQIASRLGMKAAVVISDGDEPIGSGIGPVLEAMDVLKVLRSTADAPADLRNKALMVGGKLLELIGMEHFHHDGTGEELMARVIDSGQAYEKFSEIIAAQDGDPDVSLDDLRERLAPLTFDIVANTSGMIIDIQNQIVAKVARMAGAPQNHGCGIYFHHKFEDIVAKGELLATVYCGNPDKLRRARRILDSTEMIFIR